MMNTMGYERRERPQIVTDKTVPVRTFLHYSDPQAREELNVFGKARDGLFYNYDDRLCSEKWHAGLELAERQAAKDSARYFELALSHFHDAKVNLEHIVLGCNRSNGFSYLIFGYTY